MNGQPHALAALSLGEEPTAIHFIEGWVGPRTCLMDEKARKIQPNRDSNSDSLAVQPAVCRYTDCAIPAPLECTQINLNV
jgi:hypothetical protein